MLVILSLHGQVKQGETLGFVLNRVILVFSSK